MEIAGSGGGDIMMGPSEVFWVGGGRGSCSLAQQGGAAGSSGGHVATHQATPGTTATRRLFLATFDLGARAAEAAVPELARWSVWCGAGVEGDDGLGGCFCHD